MATERGSSTRLDRSHDTTLAVREVIALGNRNASPWRRKMSATSNAGRTDPAQSGGITSTESRSNGLAVRAMRSVATCA